MINPLSSAPPPPPQGQRTSLALSDEQNALISDTLDNLDADNLSQAQALEIVETFAAAGINPSKELASTLADAGFDARAIGDLANSAPPAPQATSEQVDLSDLVDYLDTLLEKVSGTALSETDKTNVYDGLRERFGLNDGESILNVTA